MKGADRSENPWLGEKEGSPTLPSPVSASARGGHWELLSALTCRVPGSPHLHTPPPHLARPQAPDAEGVTQVLKPQGQSHCDHYIDGYAPDEPFAALSLFSCCLNYEEQPLLSGIFWCISLCISSLGTGSREPTSISVLFVFPGPLTLLHGALLCSLLNLDALSGL